ncbi:hypothetical protein GPECTOR_5g33 [Gonium pectorale]|uniref:Uncharacterized protein n=1 Tax=Gonium pectorale TaxID=33097 RepID=A0A150GWQ8_GONPE|nr:hypothetical protein GPECTOR_5g33 [Gonium pectorale]|eukprot:KXZ54239.1 hypothetical protein GPECTOR_5g33 [Gonium pectorale]
MVCLSSLTRLTRANFRSCDFYADEVEAWTTWGPCLTRLEMSSGWQMTLDAVPLLLPSLRALVELDLPDHCLDTPMWRRLTSRLPALAVARFGWVDLPAEGGEEAHDEEGEEGGEEEAGAGGAGGPEVLAAPDGEAAQRRQELQPHRGLRVLRLDGPWEGDKCGRPLLPLLPALEELRVGEDAAALAAIARDDPSVYDRLERALLHSRLLAPPPPPAAAASAGTAAARSLRLLVAPRLWLTPAMAGLGSLTSLRLLPSPAAVASAAAFDAEVVHRGTWPDPRVGAGGVPWAGLAELDVPRDLDAAALLPLFPSLQRLTISQSFGDALLALALAGPLPPSLRELTLAGELKNVPHPESYRRELLVALAARGLRRLLVTRGSLMAGRGWAREQRGLRLAGGLEQLGAGPAPPVRSLAQRSVLQVAELGDE